MRTNKIQYIEGIRGIATLQVILCHLICAFYPALYFLSPSSANWQRVFINTPLSAAYRGNIAVHFFFLISGYFICKKTMSIEYKSLTLPQLGEGVLVYIKKRYFRLLEITVPAVVLSYLLMASGWMFHNEVVDCTGNAFLTDYNQFAPSILGAIYDGFLKVFIIASDYVEPLWTIKVEFICSILVYLIGSTVSNYMPRRQNRMMSFDAIISGTWLLCGMLAFFHSIYFTSFFMGAFVCSISRSSIRIHPVAAVVFFVVGLYFMCCNNDFTGIWSPLGAIGLNATIMRSMGSIIVFYFIVNSIRVQNLLEFRLLTFLGSHSAFLYAFHWQIVLSLGCFLFLVLHKAGVSMWLTCVAVFICCILATVALSVLYSKLKEAITEKWKTLIKR